MSLKSEMFVVARLHRKLIAVPAAGVQEILIAPLTASVPGAPHWIRGVFNFRGRVLPLIDLRHKLTGRSAVADVEISAPSCSSASRTISTG